MGWSRIAGGVSYNVSLIKLCLAFQNEVCHFSATNQVITIVDYETKYFVTLEKIKLQIIKM